MRSPSSARILCLLLGSLALSIRAASGQECPEGRISYIFIDNRSIFDLSEIEPGAPFRWAYGLANTLHVRTRTQFIEDELLFHTGECLDPLLLEETERLLRGYRFIGQADVYAIPQPDGTQHVNVYTQDEWTTKVDVGLRLDDGVKFTGVEATEENFLGRGILLKGFFEEEKESRNLGVEFQTSRVFGTRWDSRVSAGKTRNGNFLEQAFVFPFVGEVGRVGARQSILWRETLFAYSIQDDPNHSHLLLPFLDERADLAVGKRLGRPGHLTVLGIGVSKESVRFRDFPSDVEYVVGEDFSNTVPVDSLGLASILGQAERRRANRINVYLGRRNLRFVQRRGLDALRGIQDVQVGLEAFIGLGRSFQAIQERGSKAPADLHTQLSLFAGGAWDGWTLNGEITSEARQVYQDRGEPARWKDVFAEADAYLYWQPTPGGQHTFLFRASGAGGWSVKTPYQLTLGGRVGVRGYREDEFPGARRLIMTLEDRMYLPWPAPGLFDFGFSAFLDMGFMRGGEVPFGVNSGWRAAIGGGIRFGLPPGTANVVRLDLALPIGPQVQAKDLVVRVSLQELLGILPGFRDNQVLRSLRAGVRPTLVSLPW